MPVLMCDSFPSDEAQPPALLVGNCNTSLHLKEITSLPLCFRRFQWLVSTCKDGWKAYYRQPVFLAGMGLAFLYTTVLGFDCITTGYAYTQGISGSLLSLLMGVSAITGLLGTVMFTRLRKTYGLVNTGIISSCIHLGCLLLCVCSVFAPGSPMDLSLLMPYITSNSSAELGGMAGKRQKHTYPLMGGSNQPLLPDRSSIHWTNNTVLFDNVPSGTTPESYISIILLFLGVITARIGEYSQPPLHIKKNNNNNKINLGLCKMLALTQSNFMPHPPVGTVHKMSAPFSASSYFENAVAKSLNSAECKIVESCGGSTFMET